MFENVVEVEFGDCDPAGIVFYPRFLAWFDATYQKWLRAHDVSHHSLQQNPGFVGTGLIDVGARFILPVRPGDTLTLTGKLDTVSEKSFRIRYAGHVDDKLSLEGHEVRGLFVLRDGVIKAAPLAPLWEQMGIDP